MRPSPAALFALALLLGSLGASAAASNDSFCSRLANNSSDKERRSISQNGVPTRLKLVWGSEPAHAASAMLSALLRRVYNGVQLSPTPHPHDTAALATNVTLNDTGEYDELLIGVSTAWHPAKRGPEQGPSLGLAGPRLAELGFSPVPARRRLLAWLAPAARALLDCQRSVRWLFYANQSALATCAFVSPQGPTVDFLAVGDCNVTLLDQLQKRANATHISLNRRRVDRASFLLTLHNASRSFLFLDYDMWNETDGVSVVEPPPCVFGDFNCIQELDSAIALRVADVGALQMYAPELVQYVQDFNPSLKALRDILERQARGVDIEEAACEWALNNNNSLTQPKKIKYIISIFVCNDGYNIKQYDEIISKVGNLIYKSTQEFDIAFKRYFIDCSDDNHMSGRLNKICGYMDVADLIGVVSMTVQGAAAAAVTAANCLVPLLLADVVPEEACSATTATWCVAGRPRHIVLALRHFVIESGWKRVAVLSQDMKLAHDYHAAFEDEAIVIRRFPIEGRPIETVLQDLRDTNARIVFINTNSRAALTILRAAAADGMGYSHGYVWILREWLPDEDVPNDSALNGTKHFTISFWSRRMDELPLAEGWKPLHDNLNVTRNLDHLWPPRAASLANALLSLAMGFTDVFLRHPHLRRDLRSPQMIRFLEETLKVNPVLGVGQRLHYAERSIEETFVFVDQWRDGHFDRRLATWRVNASNNGAVHHNCSGCSSYWPHDIPRDDGTSGCTVRSGDRFTPTCHDPECACALLLLALAPGAVMLARHALRRRLTRMQREQQIELITRRRHVATVLAAYLVERAALELCEEIGAGRFGSVCRARLREPGRAPRYIAAKALRDSAAPTEESEFLREACMIASLEHPHIVRLVGVCISDGPPLVLMELAFFGDLLGYLRERRHLVEDTGSEEPAASGEAEHVSAEALTRLAREAAEALQYLSVRGFVHRDVRAANCLVDERRSLKLADFGMARETVASADGAPEYACRRRGLFPVLWMAPESLAHGVFSAASDVWALGVLVLELVTLGVRPYGSMSPLRVLEYVAAGGSPPLPLDATPQTRGLVRLCWARVAERRPSAAAVAAYLAAWPRALHPALLTERDEPADVDSGFGESPSTELLPPDSPLNSFDQLDDIAATH